VWQYVDLSTPNAPYLIAVELEEPPTIEQLIAKIDKERAKVVQAWEADERPEAEKGRRPRAPTPTKFDDVKEEYAAR